MVRYSLYCYDPDELYRLHRGHPAERSLVWAIKFFQQQAPSIPIGTGEWTLFWTDMFAERVDRFFRECRIWPRKR